MTLVAARILTAHVFDKVRELDLSLAEFEALLDGGTVVETTPLPGLERKEVVLVLGWQRPLHVVLVVDGARREERIITVYEPHADRWRRGLQERRRR